MKRPDAQSLIVILFVKVELPTFRTFVFASSNGSLFNLSSFQGHDYCRCSLVRGFKQELPEYSHQCLHQCGSHVQHQGANTSTQRTHPPGKWWHSTSQSTRTQCTQFNLLARQFLGPHQLLGQLRKSARPYPAKWVRSNGDSSWMSGTITRDKLKWRIRNFLMNSGHVWWKSYDSWLLQKEVLPTFMMRRQ